MTRPKRIISGGQTGADRAGLEAAIQLAIEPGGWVPKGRIAEDGPIRDELMILYKLQEHHLEGYPPRTKQNVFDSDGTVLFGDMNSAGSRKTVAYCKYYNKPYIYNPSREQFLRWLELLDIKVLNVAGNRESVSPGIYASTLKFLVEALTEPESTMTVVVNKAGKSESVTFKRTLPDPGCPELDSILNKP